MKIRRGLIAGVAALAAVTVCAEQKKPNILFILSDDHALESISAYGSWLKDFAKTPNIDRLAKEGMLFTNLCCNNSICSPSRASVMTGQYNHVNGVMKLNGKINPDSPWLSKELKNGGYQTWLVGKWHLKSAPEGFDDYRVVKGQGTYSDPKYSGPNGISENVTGYSSDKYTDQALEWLKTRDTKKPFCLMLQFKAPHHPYDYPERLNGLLKGVQIPEPSTLYEDLSKTSPNLKEKCFGQMGRARSYYGRHLNDTEPPMGKENVDTLEGRIAAAYQHMVHKYIRCITAVDENVGRMLKYLDKEGLTDSTIIVYTSDQGYWLGQHGLYDKRLILDESLKMPFVIRYPSTIKASSKNSDLCSNVDIAPTLLDMAGLPVPESMQGRSLLPLLKGSTPDDWRDAVWYNYISTPNHYGIKTAEYTLVHFHGSDDIEFYDNKKDPEQKSSVHNNVEYKELIAAAENKMKAVMTEVDLTPSAIKGMPQKGSGKKKKKK
jgi:arylsulfatase A-like enzyme